MSFIDPLLIHIVILSLAATASAAFAYFLKIPSIITHIIAGICIGPFALGLIKDKEIIQEFGGFGIILLLFFIGMEISIQHIIAHWRIIALNTLLHAVVSVAVILLFGWFFAWPMSRSILLGMIISLSSTAILLRYFEEQKSLHTKLGREITGILIAQDLLAIPILLIISACSPEKNNTSPIEQILIPVGALTIILYIVYRIIKHLREKESVYHIATITHNAEVGLFTGIALCFGCALLTTSLNLPAALGAFLAGIIFARLNMPEKVRKRIIPFKIFFMMLFFMSIGMLIDMSFLIESLPIVLFLVFMIFVFNTLVRAIFFRSAGASWHHSLYASSLLAHAGEFSFFVVAAGSSNGLISNFSYQITVIMIATSILLSPLWIKFFSRFEEKEILPI